VSRSDEDADAVCLDLCEMHVHKLSRLIRIEKFI
jgi:hypothetical protein